MSLQMPASFAYMVKNTTVKITPAGGGLYNKGVRVYSLSVYRFLVRQCYQFLTHDLVYGTCLLTLK